jgi:hypothetical protein
MDDDELTEEGARLYEQLRELPVVVEFTDERRQRLLGELGYTEHNIIELMSMEVDDGEHDESRCYDCNRAG